MQYDQEEYEGYVQLPYIRRTAPKRKIKPIIANLADTQYQVVEQVCWEMNYNLIYDRESKNWDLKWIDGPVSVDMLNKMQSHQKINHFPGMNALSRKNNLAKNLTRMQYAFPQHYAFIPQTFLLPGDNQFLRSYYNDCRRKGITKTFIVKPEASCQGRGIFLSQDLAGLKFDLRIYALVAGCDPLRLYIYNEGLVRFATEKYEAPTQENLDDLCMHLTNYAINKENPKYVFNESLDNLSLGHKKSLAEFFQTLKGMGLPAHEYWSGIKDTIVKTIITGQPHLQHEYRMAQPNNIPNNMCFQILGFDFMLDDRNKLYLLEVNYTPSFSTETPLDQLIKSNIIRDTIVIMNVTPQARNIAQKIAKEELERRMYTGKKIKLSGEERDRAVIECQKERDQYEKKNIGSFQKIFPSRNMERQQKYQKLLEQAKIQYLQVSSPHKIGNPRRSNSKYRIKRIISTHANEQDHRESEGKKKINVPLNNNPQIMKSPTTGQKHLLSKPINSIERLSEERGRTNASNRRPQYKSFSGIEMKQMDLSMLRTRNEQPTMFSKQQLSMGH